MSRDSWYVDPQSPRVENRKTILRCPDTQQDRGEGRSGFRSETRGGAPDMGATIPCRGWARELQISIRDRWIRAGTLERRPWGGLA